MSKAWDEGSVEATARRSRWAAPGRAKVTHPRHGSVVVPCGSKYGAILNAAEYWGCKWTEISDAEVYAAMPGDGKCVRPREYIQDAIEALKGAKIEKA